MRRLRRSLRELRRELAERQVLRLLLDQPERRDVPERRRAAVAEHDLVTVGRAEQRREPLADTSYDALHTLLAVRRPEVRRPGGRERGELLGTHLRRAGPEPPVTRAQLSGDHEIGVAHPPILSDLRYALRYRADHDHAVCAACRGRGDTEVGTGARPWGCGRSLRRRPGRGWPGRRTSPTAGSGARCASARGRARSTRRPGRKRTST